jgi:hypothetical protein
MQLVTCFLPAAFFSIDLAAGKFMGRSLKTKRKEKILTVLDCFQARQNFITSVSAVK